MIYPEFFPKEREHEFAEKGIFEKLSELSDKYDIFYSRRFVNLSGKGKPEYEIDFIIAEPNKALLCIEVKGGIISYSGSVWTQNGRRMTKAPDEQASSAMNALVKKYPDLSRGIPFSWCLCFPDCEIPSTTPMPPALPRSIILDQQDTLFFEMSLKHRFEVIKKKYENKAGCRDRVYQQFKTDLLRGLGFVKLLSTRIKHDEQRFVELTDRQFGLFKKVELNNSIIIPGPAGSGKTIIAKTIAKEYASTGKRVLFLTFNRTIANKIRYDIIYRGSEEDIRIATFHSFARDIIGQFDTEWWTENENKSGRDFWELEIPSKVEDIIDNEDIKKYDVLIIDEGQDFKEFWYDVIFKLIEPKGKKYIFIDEIQDIFKHFIKIPNSDSFFKYPLTENCRNTKNIVEYLNEKIGETIQVFEKSPRGSEVHYQEFVSSVAQQTAIHNTVKNLLNEHQINTNQILILLNSQKENSCLSNSQKIANYPFVGLDRKAIYEKGKVHYSTIKQFKGLEADIVIIIDAHLIESELKNKLLYTQASRAKHKLFIFGLVKRI